MRAHAPAALDFDESAPWSLYARHAGKPWSVLLDRCGAPSFACSSPVSQLVVDAGGRVRLWRDGAWRVRDAHPLDALAAYVEESAASARAAERALGGESFLPRTVGVLAYELGAFIEDVPVAGLDPSGLPLAVLSTYDRVDVWTPGAGAVETFTFDGACARPGAPPPACAVGPLGAAPSATHLRRGYEAGFAHVIEAIRAGDIYQANLSRCIDLPFDEPADDAYQRLRGRQPVRHGAFLDLGTRQILSNSPERFLRVAGDLVETMPIKGTRARHGDAAADRAAASELARDPKERAEHLMIVDLERNDLGRVCRTGTVEVARFAEVHSYATVHHLVSTVRGRLRAEVGTAELLRATFPGGSITGAPKVRSMEIIAEVEPHARGVYTGAIGAWNGNRAVDLNVAIRTAVAGAGRIRYSTGGGIVADSRLQSEYDETVTKARAFLESAAASAPRAHAAL